MKELNLIISFAAFLVHFPFGFYRVRYKKFSRPWGRCLYIPIVLNIVIRRFVLHWDWQTAMIYLWPVVILAHILGSIIGSRYKPTNDVEIE